MKRYYLAIDIGASSGRHILGHMEDGKMVLEEVYRFPNGMQKRDGEKVWDIEALFEAVLAGMKKCRELGKIPVSVGIDTWAVDFVLLDKDDQRIGNAVAYRDDRTKGMDEEVYRTVPEEELYASTGIQKQIFNSIYQLFRFFLLPRHELINTVKNLFLNTGRCIEFFLRHSSKLCWPE